MSKSTKIVLGTVQFGVNYGINNAVGQVPAEEVEKILTICTQQGITTLDTSSAYGTSEKVLGSVLQKTGYKFRIVSKYPKSENSVRETFERSLQNLGAEHLYGYLVHHFEFYQEHPAIFDEMQRLKDEGRIERIGFSLYNTQQLEYLLEHNVKFDLLQFPYNIFDRQFELYMEELVSNGVEIHTRSAFLQGLFFKDTDTLPEKLVPLKPYLDELHRFCTNKGISVEGLAMGYLLANRSVSGLLIGVDNHEQLERNLHVAETELSDESLAFIKTIAIKEKKLLNPVNWK